MIVEQIGFISAHYGYTEEYILSHTPEWLVRKYKQTIREKREESCMRIVEGCKSIALFTDLAFNKGRQVNQILPPSFEEMGKQRAGNSKPNKSFVTEKWWEKT